MSKSKNNNNPNQAPSLLTRTVDVLLVILVLLVVAGCIGLFVQLQMWSWSDSPISGPKLHGRLIVRVLSVIFMGACVLGLLAKFWERILARFCIAFERTKELGFVLYEKSHKPKTEKPQRHKPTTF